MQQSVAGSSPRCGLPGISSRVHRGQCVNSKLWPPCPVTARSGARQCCRSLRMGATRQKVHTARRTAGRHFWCHQQHKYHWRRSAGNLLEGNVSRRQLTSITRNIFGRILQHRDTNYSNIQWCSSPGHNDTIGAWTAWHELLGLSLLQRAISLQL